MLFMFCLHFINRSSAINIRRKDAVGGFFSQVGDLYMVHHLWGELSTLVNSFREKMTFYVIRRTLNEVLDLQVGLVLYNHITSSYFTIQFFSITTFRIFVIFAMKVWCIKAGNLHISFQKIS